MATLLFPFGQPVLARQASASGHRPAYVLGAYPSGVHVQWTPPAVNGAQPKPVRALLIDNEPTPFWRGDDEAEHIENWKQRVDWRPEWGQVATPSRGTNGPSGAWLEESILRPLGIDRENACISDCLDTARLNRNQDERIRDTYAPVAEVLNLASCSVVPVPDGEDGIVAEACHGHLPRLRTEIGTCRPRVVVTLGNAALRVFARLLDDESDAPSRLVSETYGRPLPASIGGHEVTWLPLVHPRSGERTPPWPEVHRRWMEDPPTLP